jgi:hypothetical protein
VLVLKPIFEDEQRFLMETQPETFFLTGHYRGYGCILVRLSWVDAAMLEDMLARCWRELAPKKVLAAYDAEHTAPRR